MAEHTVQILWQRGDQDFLDNRYSRRHLLRFDGGAELAGSSSPHIVPEPMSDRTAVDPEESFVASIASCHMLWFLSIAQQRGFRVDRYQDRPIGVVQKNAADRLAITKVTLRPDAAFSGDKSPTEAEIRDMHHAAHEACFIANSVTSDIACEPVFAQPIE